MDEITLVNLLNEICDKSGNLTWKLKFGHPNSDDNIMQVNLLCEKNHAEMSQISFHMDTGRVIDGRHRNLVKFKEQTNLVDALLDILIYENRVMTFSGN